MSIRLQQTLAIAAGVVVALVMMWLGVWQMASYQESTRDVSAERAAEAPTPLSEAVASDGVVQDIYGKRVTFTGVYLPEYEVTVGSASPWRVLTLMETADSRYIAVVRGSVDATDASEGIPAPPQGTQSVEGIFLAPDLPEASRSAEADYHSVRIQELAQEWPSPLIAGYVTLPGAESEAQGLEEARLVLPTADGSPTHRGYALQWWVFAAGAIVFGLYSARELGKTA
ncbi:SURF1 family protein [Tessaracoccus sp. MC1865]|uniref:SURF1 family protein n=1 Tax=Tessaracoccus sp. MC1865 TaxID=2760310 RepID=UPI0016004B83|nr:SURF1 family protein [Tessaracoccus sp. MC1865]MBB1483049.1 SURF1 family protein [Tessaracoccus sp. MC1865]QTO37519.1 SURF1 family protein [Tessaracoccus sp. MC1865]